MSKHLLQQELLKKTITPFNGDPIHFWPWLGKIRNYVEQLEMSPLNVLEFVESHCTGKAKEYVSNTLAAVDIPSVADIQFLWREMIKRYGSSSKIASKLRARIEEFPVINPRSE